MLSNFNLTNENTHIYLVGKCKKLVIKTPLPIMTGVFLHSTFIVNKKSSIGFGKNTIGLMIGIINPSQS